MNPRSRPPVIPLVSDAACREAQDASTKSIRERGEITWLGEVLAPTQYLFPPITHRYPVIRVPEVSRPLSVTCEPHHVAVTSKVPPPADVNKTLKRTPFPFSPVSPQPPNISAPKRNAESAPLNLRRDKIPVQQPSTLTGSPPRKKARFWTRPGGLHPPAAARSRSPCPFLRSGAHEKRIFYFFPSAAHILFILYTRPWI